MRDKTDKLITINMVFIMSLIVSNVLAGKIVKIGVFEVPSAVVAYGITFLCTDIINEIWGKDEANKTVKRGFFIQLASLMLIYIATKLTPADYMIEYNQSFLIIFTQSARMTIASLTAYVISQANDVFIFNKLRQVTDGDKKWLRNNLSTMMSQIIDTAIFITIAFYGTVPSLWTLVISQYVVKAIIALLDTPFFYYFTREI